MIPPILSTLVLAAMGALGWAGLNRFGGHLSRLERFAYGVPIGMVVATLALALGAIAVGLSAPLVLADALACAILAAWLSWGGGAFDGSLGDRLATAARSIDWSPAGFARAARRRVRWLPAIVIVAFAIHGALYWPGALTYQDGALWAGHVNLWGDDTVHLGIVSSFAYGGNFPPEHPRFAGYPFAYHWLADLTAAALVPLGMDPTGALGLHSYLTSVVAAIALYVFARRITRSELAGTLAVVLFLLGGNLAWTVPVDRALREGIGPALDQGIWDYRWKTDLNFWWVNMFWGFWMSQRAFLYGMPMAFAILRSLMIATRRPRAWWLWIFAGVIAGLLPFAHLATLLALAIVVPFLFLLTPSRGWVLFGLVWVGIAAPQLLWQQGGEPGALSFARILVGWMAIENHVNWVWFWIVNVGLFIPLAAVAFLWRGTLRGRTWRLLLAFMPLFVLGNLAVLQPWDWDNQKWLVYWFMAAAIAAAAVLARVWREHRGFLVRAVVLGAIATMTLSGIFETVGQALGESRYQMLDSESVTLAADIRARTAPRSLFLTGMYHHDAVSMLTGRRLFVGSADWLGTEGVPYQGRAAEATTILQWRAGAADLIAANHIDYVVIGTYERTSVGADESAFRARYRVVIDTGNYQVFAVSPAAASAARPPG
jgi:hypothetical protein